MNPEKIGRYEIKSELGRGGMATVYCAYDPRFEREVAIKVLPREMLHDTQFRVRFEREAKTVAMLEHPAIVPVYDVGEEDGQPYFVMRYMTGGSLSDRLKKGSLSVADAAHVIERIASALDEAHAKGIIHRDLKPGNILFDSHNEPYISDFGIAKFSQSQTNVTGGAIVGTPAYISPEQAQGETIDGRSDIYALGVILFEMLSGRQPYEADTPMGVVVKHITEPVPHILDVNPGLPSDVEMIIERAMAKDRNDRFSTSSEMAAVLQAVAHGEALDSATLANATRLQMTKVKRADASGTRPLSRTAPPAEQPRRGGFSFVVIALIVVCIVLGGGAAAAVYFIGKQQATPAPTQTPPVVIVSSPTPKPTEPPTDTPVPPTQTLTPAPTETMAPVVPTLPVIGGADQIAFLRSNDIWIMNMDGTGLRSLTSDGAAKGNLQWLPDGKTLLYLQGKTVKTVNMESMREDIIVSYNSAEFLDAFQVSPDGTRVAISVNNELFVLPYDPAVIGANFKKSQMLEIIKNQGCLFYGDVATKGVLWSDDGTKLAVNILAPRDGLFSDIIRVLDISKCSTIPPDRIDDFPGQRFDYAREIVNFSWDGDLLFIINNNKRNNGFGILTLYNMDTHKHEDLSPIRGVCCYRDATWSPDGQYILFAFQDIEKGATSPIDFYLVSIGSINSPGILTPIGGEIPTDFFKNLRDAPKPVMRPALQP